MIIHPPKIHKSKTKIGICAYIEIESRPELSGNLWFEFDREYEPFISKSSNGFLANMLLLAMYLKEDIAVRGKISPKLEYNLQEVQSYFNFWKPKDFPYHNPRKFHKVNIKHEGYVEEKQKQKGVMCTFSGGLDSFYTLYKHLPGQQSNSEHQVTHCLHLDGFNNPLSEERTHYYNIYHKRFKSMENKYGIKIIGAKSNVQDFYVKKYEAYSPCHYGVTLSGVAMFLEPMISRFYIASSYEYGTFKPEGSNPITDPMLSTENMQTIHYDCSKSRIQKAVEIADWEESYDKMMVCFDEKEYNCGRCEKCVRTMITLHLAGKLSNYSTFPEPLTRQKVRHWHDRNKTHRQEVVDYAKHVQNKEVLEDLFYFENKNTRKAGLLHKTTQIGNHIWAWIWLPSAFLKKRSRLYNDIVTNIKSKIA